MELRSHYLSKREAAELAGRLRATGWGASALKDEKVRDAVSSESRIPNRFELLRMIDEAFYEYTRRSYRVTYFDWVNMVYPKIAARFPSLQDPLRETFDPPKSRFVKTREVAIAVHTTGKRDDDPVFIEVAGGRASEIAEVVEEAKAREV